MRTLFTSGPESMLRTLKLLRADLETARHPSAASAILSEAVMILAFHLARCEPDAYIPELMLQAADLCDKAAEVSRQEVGSALVSIDGR